MLWGKNLRAVEWKENKFSDKTSTTEHLEMGADFIIADKEQTVYLQKPLFNLGMIKNKFIFNALLFQTSIPPRGCR